MKAVRSSRRGRPPSERPAHDRGTPELQAHRSTLCGSADPAASEHPLLLMTARGLIPVEWQASGFRYAMLYRSAVGRVDVSYNRLYDGLLGLKTHGAQAELQAETERERIQHELYLAGKAALLRRNRQICRDTEAIVVFAIWPGFLKQAKTINDNLADCDRRHLNRVAEGLSILHDVLSATPARRISPRIFLDEDARR